MHLFIQTLFEDPFTYLSWIGLVAFSICFHEYAHAQMALRLGDDTAARQGHLSLNPLVQMGGSSIIMLLLIGIAWGAVPVDPRRIRGRGAAAAVSVSGPASNLLLSLVFGAVSVGTGLLMMRHGVESLLSRFFALGSVANGVLFVFNMLPVPMLDGWSVFSLFIPRMRAVDPLHAQNVSWIFILLIFLTPLGAMIWGLGTWTAEMIMTGWYHFFALFL